MVATVGMIVLSWRFCYTPRMILSLRFEWTVKQWAAVTIHSGWISDPPHAWYHSPSRLYWISANHGQVLGMASWPPMTRGTRRGGLLPHSANKRTFSVEYEYHCSGINRKNAFQWNEGSITDAFWNQMGCWFSIINHLSPNSDKHVISPYNITTWSNMQLMRIEEMITKYEMSWCSMKFFQLVT